MITIINERQGYYMSENNQSLRMAQLALQAMEEKKAEDIKIIDIHEVSTIADYFLIASGITVVRFKQFVMKLKKHSVAQDIRKSRARVMIRQTGY